METKYTIQEKKTILETQSALLLLFKSAQSTYY